MARLIDADALKKQIEDFHCKDCNNYNFVRCRACHIDDAISYLDEAPTIGGWISVNERLPEEHADEHPYEFEQFLCATVFEDVRVYGFGTRVGDDEPHFWHGPSIMDCWVTHWMPMPEIPKEDENAKTD